MAKSNPSPLGAQAAAILLSTALLTACDGGGHPEPAPSRDLDLRIEWLDQDLFRSAGDTGANFSLKLYAEYGSFFKDYVEKILQAAPIDDPRLPIALTSFVMNPDWRAVQQRADSVFGDMGPQRAEFETAIERLLSYFPDSIAPRVVVYNSGFNYGIAPTDSVLGIGVEWFIGPDHKVIDLLAPDAFPQYLKERMRPEMLVPSAVKGWLQTHYTRDTRGEDVLTNLVEIGRVMYLLNTLLIEINPALNFAFTDAQLKWCEDNEFNIWTALVTGQVLYSKKADDVDRLLNDGPFTNGFPRESPGHIGEWIGFRMVSAYMKAHPEVTMAQLFALDDPRVVLKSYKPR